MNLKDEKNEGEKKQRKSHSISVFHSYFLPFHFFSQAAYLATMYEAKTRFQ